MAADRRAAAPSQQQGSVDHSCGWESAERAGGALNIGPGRCGHYDEQEDPAIRLLTNVRISKVSVRERSLAFALLAFSLPRLQCFQPGAHAETHDDADCGLSRSIRRRCDPADDHTGTGYGTRTQNSRDRRCASGAARRTRNRYWLLRLGDHRCTGTRCSARRIGARLQRPALARCGIPRVDRIQDVAQSTTHVRRRCPGCVRRGIRHLQLAR